MAATKQVWGIDLGQCALKALCLRSIGEKVEVAHHVYIEHERILSQPDVDRQALIETAIKQFVEKHELSKDALVVGVPGQHTLARFSKLPPVKLNKVPEIVKYEAQQQIPFDMDEVIWDYQVFTDAATGEMEVGIFAMRRELLRSHLSFLSTLNLEPAAVQASPLALYNTLKFEGLCATDAATVIVDIGAQNTDLIVAEGETLWTRNIPIGGNNFTEALLKTFKLSFRKAESLKRKAGTHKYARQIFQAMRPVFADLVAEIQRSLGFFTSSRRGVKLGRVVAMGSAFKLPGMVKFVQQNLGMEVVRPSTFQKLSLGDAANDEVLKDQLLSFGVAYGLALQGLGRSQITSNLLPPEIAKQVIWRKKTPWFYGAAACLALAAATVWARNTMDMSQIAAARGDGRGDTFQEQVDPDVPHEEAVPEVDPRAYEVLARGPQGPAAASSLGHVKTVVAAGQHLQQVRSRIESANENELNKVQEVATLQTHKVVWPRILHLIHSSLPAPDPRLNEALLEGIEAYQALVRSDPDTFARPNRRVIFLNSFEAEYSADVGNAFRARIRRDGPRGGASPFGGPRAGTGGADTAAASATREELKSGFLITLRGQTPNAGGPTFIEQEFFDQLRKNADDIPGFYVYGTHVLTIPQYRQAGRGTMAPRMPMPRGPAGAGVTATDPGTDPITGESMLDDYVPEMVIAIVLGEKPETPAATGMMDDGTDGLPGMNDY